MPLLLASSGVTFPVSFTTASPEPLFISASPSIVIPVTRCFTVTVQVPCALLPSCAVAVIVAWPAFSAVTSPVSSFTFATSGWLLLHFTSLFVVFSGVTVAVNSFVLFVVVFSSTCAGVTVTLSAFWSAVLSLPSFSNYFFTAISCLCFIYMIVICWYLFICGCSICFFIEPFYFCYSTFIICCCYFWCYWISCFCFCCYFATCSWIYIVYIIYSFCCIYTCPLVRCIF